MARPNLARRPPMKNCHLGKVRFLQLSYKEGKLIETTEDGIVIETEKGKGKKKEVNQESILFTDIKTTKIQIKF